jgi:predicted nucleotidyltransferase
MIDDVVLTQVAQQLRSEEPDAIAIVLHGSHARGEAGFYSDIDLDVMLGSKPTIPYKMLLLEQEHGRLLHISIGFRLWSAWQTKQQAPAQWSFSLPVRQPIRVLWAILGMDRQQLEKSYTQPTGSAETEDFLECAGKVKNAYLAGDEPGLRLAAHNLAYLCPSLLISLNAVAPVTNQNEALKAILSFPVAPPHYREDMLVCLGFAGSATSITDVYTSALRLARGVIRLIQSNPAAIAADGTPNIPLYLADGSIQRYLEQ